MEIKRATEYEACGCKFYGADDSIAYVEYFDESSRASAKKPLNGFGSGTCFDFADKAEALIKSVYGEGYKVLLGMPVLVVRLTPEQTLLHESK